jgi:hypothetical protein
MEAWGSQELIDATRDRFAAAIPGWRFPVAFGIGRPTGDGVEFARVNRSAGKLPAVVLGTVCGHAAGSASYAIDRAALERAVELASPAEAYTGIPHPNIKAWRDLLARPGDDFVVVFDGGDDSDDPRVAALRAAP